jgi:uncharacterized protein
VNSFESLLSRANQHGNLGRNDREVFYDKLLAASHGNLDDDDHGGSLVPILALAHEHDPDPEMRPYQEPISAERREDLIIGIAAGVMRIYKYFRRPSPQEMSLVSESSTYRRALPKVGRNEPCPCGSGKKFKHCCGKITLH